ncbi:P-loop containing nucleoside triphosphate hydrolase protein [Atractiella rhizophila]|nr:P-loop containing nucleoside triphosphate hydrolase protein [Atractiella rhizophila]
MSSLSGTSRLLGTLAAMFVTLENDAVHVERVASPIRSTISIIPQTATLFRGTIRSNLSPVEDRTDDELWNALELAGLKDYVSTLENKLDEELQIGGKNFSSGQLQQIGLARASLQQVKILVLDEVRFYFPIVVYFIDHEPQATSNLDRVSDDHIQQAIRKHFGHCTLITIAHRIRTIIDYDKIAVMDNGVLVEFAPPRELLKNEDGYFYKLWKESGEL